MKIMREPEPDPQVRQQVEDLRLDRHVERAHRLVGDQHLGIGRERPRDADPLALAAREVGWISLDRASRQTHLVEELLHAPGDLVPGDEVVDRQDLAEGGPDRQPGIERRVRILEHDLDAAPRAPELAAAEAA